MNSLNLDAIRARQKRALVSVSQERPNEYDPDHCNRAAYILTVTDVPALLAEVERLRAEMEGLRERLGAQIHETERAESEMAALTAAETDALRGEPDD